MLEKKEDRIEIWSDGLSKEESKRWLKILLILEFIVIIVSFICFKGTERWIAIIGWALMYIIAFGLHYRREKQKYLMFAVDPKYIEIYSVQSMNHKMVKKIELEQINKVKTFILHSRYSYSVNAEISYREGNVEKKYTFRLTNYITNQIAEWLITALREYKKDIVIEDKTTGDWRLPKNRVKKGE